MGRAAVWVPLRCSRMVMAVRAWSARSAGSPGLRMAPQQWFVAEGLLQLVLSVLQGRAAKVRRLRCRPDAPHALSPKALSAAMESRKQDMELLSNSMAAYAHIRANPESFGLYFVLGVCFGLVLTLCLLLLRISCRPRTQHTARPGPADLSEDDDDDEDEEEDTVDRAASESLLPMTEIPLEPHSPGDGAAPINVFASAEELERAQRLEERERIIREIWRNGQPDLLGAGTLGRGHYY